jgi:hypothetical protein
MRTTTSLPDGLGRPTAGDHHHKLDTLIERALAELEAPYRVCDALMDPAPKGAFQTACRSSSCMALHRGLLGRPGSAEAARPADGLARLA